jgi:hypothetical protein
MPGIWHGERVERQRALPAQPQRLTASGQHRQARRLSEQCRYVASSWQHLFEVVQDQELLAVSQEFFQRLDGALAGGVRRTKRSGDGRGHCSRLANGGQVDETCTVRKRHILYQGGCYRGCQAGLADAARPKQRQEPHFGRNQLVANHRELFVSAEQRRWLRRDRRGHV